jgi:hypothetical protein
MEAKIIELGPTSVSHHAADPKVLNVFDVAPSSIADKMAFEMAVRADRRVSKFLLPPNDPGYHLEIPQPPASVADFVKQQADKKWTIDMATKKSSGKPSRKSTNKSAEKAAPRLQPNPAIA